MRAGSLRHRVQFQSLVVEMDSDGAQVETWVDLFQSLTPAEIIALSGRALIAAQAVQSKVNSIIKVRYRSEYRASIRGLHRGQIYNVEAVIPDPKSGIKYLSLQCSSGVNEG